MRLLLTLLTLYMVPLAAFAETAAVDQAAAVPTVVSDTPAAPPEPMPLMAGG
jgi:hypothetical protein